MFCVHILTSQSLNICTGSGSTQEKLLKIIFMLNLLDSENTQLANLALNTSITISYIDLKYLKVLEIVLEVVIIPELPFENYTILMTVKNKSKVNF